MSHDPIRNTVHGEVGTAVQVGHVGGDVHVHPSPASAAVGVHQLPPDVAGFTGRVDDLARLDSLLDVDGGSTAVVITAIAGAPGVGKTALAVHWAHRVSDRFPEGQLYVNLRGYDPGRPMAPEQVLDGFVRALGLPAERVPREVEALSGSYRSLVAGRRVLVVLDNAGSSRQVLPLLPGSPSCTVVITSRGRLSGLIARTGGRRVTIDVLSPAEAVELLRDRLGDKAVEARPQALAELAELCGRLPLALRIAAERVASQPSLGVADLNEELAAERERLDVLDADDDEATAVRSVFSWSYRALTPDAARLFRLLGLHPGPEFDVSASAALAYLPVRDARRLLDGLAGLHLLGRGARGRYRFHDLLRVYAAELVVAEDRPDVRREALRRVLAWYLHAAVEASRIVYPNRQRVLIGASGPAEPLPDFDGRAAALRWYETEQDNLLAAMRDAVGSGERALAWQLPAMLTDMLWKLPWADAIEILHAALAAAESLQDVRGQLYVLDNFADFSLDLERFDEAAAHFTRMMRLAGEIGDDYFLGSALNGLGNAHLGLGDLDPALNRFREALSTFRGIHNRGIEATVLANVAEVLRRQGDWADAVAHCRLSLAIAGELDDVWRVARAERTLGLIYAGSGDMELALEHLRRALSMHREFDNRFDVARTSTDIGDVLHRVGEHGKARSAWQDAVTIFEELGAPGADAVRRRLDGSADTGRST
ncbi:tetratricopeptide repeat protein [Actinosynnema sp. NPDC050801]|uniref:ATP-binding protein n=1 Tax=unclassified Actinosynnema TaxID=2637065 RepID=UPI00340F9B8C